MTPADDTLAAGAALAWQLAPQLCDTDPATGDGCAGMHGVWLCLRRLGLLGTIEARRDFYLEALQATAGVDGRPPRVLISGAADYAMLEFVLAAFRARGLVPDVTVTDVCETPLALNRWYAERAGCAIETVRGDILDLAPGAPYDVVCTDYFLGWIAPEHRAALVAKWRALLRPGGTVITANGLRPADDPAHRAARIEFSPAQIAQLRAAPRHHERDHRQEEADQPRDEVEPQPRPRQIAQIAAHVEESDHREGPADRRRDDHRELPHRPARRGRAQRAELGLEGGAERRWRERHVEPDQRIVGHDRTPRTLRSAW